MKYLCEMNCGIAALHYITLSCSKRTDGRHFSRILRERYLNEGFISHF